MPKRQGFTLIEILIVIGLIAVLAGVLVVALNPARQFAQARNAQRYNNLDTIMGAVINNMTDNRGLFTCAAAIPATAAKITSTAGAGNVNIGPCLSPTYVSQMPYDPSASGAHWTSVTDYDTGYTILKDATTSQITLAAPGAELSVTINLTR